MGIVEGLSRWLPEAQEQPLREVTLGALLTERAAQFPDRAAIVFSDATADIRWTYAELDAQVDRLARAMIAAEIAPGDRVAVLAPNCPEWVLLEYALARIGAVLVTVNPAFRRSELEHVLRQARVTTLFSVGAYRGFATGKIIADLRPEITWDEHSGPGPGALHQVIQLGDEEIPGAELFDAFLEREDKATADELFARAAIVRPEDVAQIQFTSGTTGHPKGAMLTHRGTVNNALLAADRVGYRETDVLVSAMPFFHTAGCVCNVMGMLAAGGCLVAMDSFDASRMLDHIETFGGTATNAVPTMYVRLLQDEKLLSGERDLSAWRIAYVGGTSIPPSLMLELHERIGCQPAIIMGMTECSPIITQTLPCEPLEKQVLTAGTPLPHVEIRVADTQTGDAVPLGAEGELHIRGFLVTAGYFDMPAETAEAIDAEGWLRSGDLAVMDGEGHLRIIGRIKDMLIRGGENLYPVEIEDHLLEHPDIAEAQIVGVADAEFGEEVFAFVVLRNGRDLNADQLRAWCRETMARHKLPRYLAFIDETPKTANGKVRKVELRALAEKMVEEGAAL